MVFCIDSNIFIWGIKRQSNPEETHRINEARDFFDWADKDGHEIVIPTIVLAECLAHEPLEKRAEILTVVYETFRVVDFDVRAALKYAEMLEGDKWSAAKTLGQSIGVNRQEMKVDFLIAASAAAHGALRLYTHDAGLTNFARPYMDVQPMPTILKQSQIEFDQQRGIFGNG